MGKGNDKTRLQEMSSMWTENKMSERHTPETDACISSTRGESIFDLCKKLERERDEALAQIVQAECRAERFCQERDEAREDLNEETKFHHRTHSELVQTQCKLMDVTQAIIATLEENRHLADGDDCTLAKLKSVIPEWK